MHYCGIIVKPKDVSVVEARRYAGDILVEKDIADWYSTDNYRERLFKNSRQVISVDELRGLWEDDFGNDEQLAFFIYEEEDILPYDTFQLDSAYNYDSFVEEYNTAYRDVIAKKLKRIDNNNYDVCLIDYHW